MKKILCILCISFLAGCNSQSTNEKIDKHLEAEGFSITFDEFQKVMVAISIDKGEVGLSALIQKGKVVSVQYHDYNSSIISCNLYNPDSTWKADTDEKKKNLKICESNLDKFLKDSGFTKEEYREYMQFVYDRNEE